MSAPPNAPDPAAADGPAVVDPPLVIAAGSRTAEAWLLAALRAHVEEARRDPALLARPLRVVVPSRSLREHLAAAIVRELGTVLGVQVQTLHGLACEVLGRTGDDTRAGDPLYPILVRRAAAAEQELREALGSLEDGYASVLGAVSDFLDAGLEPSLASSAAQRIAALAGSAASEDEALRAIALVRVAVGVRKALADRRLGRRSDRLAGASRALRHAGASVLPARALWVHGFADATGSALELIEALCRELGAIVLLDRPSDPAAGSADGVAVAGDGGASERFTRTFAERVAASRAGAPRAIASANSLASPLLLEAVGADAEVRGVAVRVRALLDGEAPCAPERIGIVARQLDPYAMPLRRHLRRLGIPFSASRSGPGGALARRLGAVVDLLRLGAAATVDRWLDARSLTPDLRADLRVAFHLVGAGRLGDVAALDVAALLGDASFLRLEVPRGLGGAGDGEDRRDEADGGSSPDAAAPPGADGPYTRRRCVSRAHLERAVAEAGEIVRCLAPRAEATLRDHLAWVRSGIAPRLGLAPPEAPGAFRGAGRAGAALHRVLGALEAELPGDERIEAGEWVRLLERGLAEEGAEPLGGAGAGVQVLDVTAARARTFEHLFVLGLNRDVFPRTVPADPLLPDSVRSALREVLPDLPVKESGYDEERHLFAQLLSSSPRITLSWQIAGDDGKPRSPSPLVERLRWNEAAEDPTRLPGVYGASGEIRAPRPAHEHAVMAALHGEDGAFGQTWPVAVSEGGGSPELAAAQLAVLRELDRFGAPDEPLGPFFGFIGPVADPRDLRRRDLYVTSAEGIARCGWRHFLARLLGVSPSPDALGALAGVDGALVGQAVHRAAERLAREVLGGGGARSELSEVLPAESERGVALRWPDDAGLAALALEASAAVLRDERLFSLPGLARAIAAEVERALRLVRQADRAEEGRILGVELRGTCFVPTPEGERALLFRADRAERIGDEIVLTDLKTGSRIHERVAKGEDTRDLHHLRAVGRGTHLQATAYALAAAHLTGRRARGRYLFVRPRDEEPAEYAVSSDDARFAEAFARSVGAVLAARDAGSFLPRIVDAGGDEPDGCSWCDVAEACVRGDSGLRGRLRRWSLARAAGAREGDAPAERALRDLWWLAEVTGP